MHPQTMYSLLFDVRRSARYHNRRRAFFDRLNLTSNAVSTIFGSAAVATALTQAPNSSGLVTASIAAVVSAVSAVNLVVGSARMARTHQDLAKRFIDLEAAMVKAPDETKEQLRQFTVERLRVEQEEPPVMRNLDTLCHNELLTAMGHPEEEHYVLTWWQGFLAHVWTIGEHRIKTKREIAGGKAAHANGVDAPAVPT